MATLPGTESESFAPTTTSWLHLRSGGVSLLLALSSAGPPRVLHWGPDLGSSPVRPPPGRWPRWSRTAGWRRRRIGGPRDAIIPEPSAHWRSSPGLSGAHDNRPTHPRFTAVSARLVSDTPLGPGLTEVGADTLIIEADDPAADLALDLALQLTETGLVRGRAGVTNRAGTRYRLDGLSLFLPVGEAATHSIELDGSPVSAVPMRTGGLTLTHHDGRPEQLVLGQPWAGFRRGQVWQVHVAFSGPVSHRAELTTGGRTYLGGGELLAAGEVTLGRGSPITRRGSSGRGAPAWTPPPPGCTPRCGPPADRPPRWSSTPPGRPSPPTTAPRC